jgi:peptide/nickel transport system permease protein
MGVARLVRAEARGVAAREHVLAARALGAGHLRVLARHVLPACLTPAVVAATLGVPQVIALEAGLSYLGLGVQPPFASWGTLIHDGADLLAIAWWISVIPGLAIIVVMLACTALGDALRDALDPRELSRR